MQNSCRKSQLHIPTSATTSSTTSAGSADLVPASDEDSPIVVAGFSAAASKEICSSSVLCANCSSVRFSVAASLLEKRFCIDDTVHCLPSLSLDWFRETNVRVFGTMIEGEGFAADTAALRAVLRRRNLVEHSISPRDSS
jgi:hypothetical protein